MDLKRLLAALAVAALLLASCGDDDDGGAASNEFSEALTEAIASEPGTPFDDAQAECLAAEFVAAVGGPSALEDQGITPDDLRASSDMGDLDLDTEQIDQDAVAAAFGTCDVSLIELLLASFGDDVPQEVKDCVTDALNEDELAEFFAQSLISGDSAEPPAAVMNAFSDCI